MRHLDSIPTLPTLGALALGASAMFLMDPIRGRSRRARVSDKVRAAARDVRDAAGVTWRDLRNRAHGLAAETRSVASGEGRSDRSLLARIGSDLGLIATHPQDGSVTLRRVWPPATRFAVGSAGTALIGASLLRRDSYAALLGTAGAIALVRAFTNTSARSLAGHSADES